MRRAATFLRHSMTGRRTLLSGCVSSARAYIVPQKRHKEGGSVARLVERGRASVGCRFSASSSEWLSAVLAGVERDAV